MGLIIIDKSQITLTFYNLIYTIKSQVGGRDDKLPNQNLKDKN